VLCYCFNQDNYTEAQRLGITQNDFIQQTIIAYLEDVEDVAIAEERLNAQGKRYTLDEYAKMQSES
jgi:predicted DNA-binding protein